MREALQIAELHVFGIESLQFRGVGESWAAIRHSKHKSNRSKCQQGDQKA
jgi:hypothetical protein